MIDPSFGHWLAGFIDGEGCFMINIKNGTPACWFQICVRDDDEAIVREIAERTGFGKNYILPANGTSRPQATWTVGRKDACCALVELLDDYPLRAKKARDFEVWREAIEVWHEPPTPLRRARLRALMHRLRDGRSYEPTPASELPPLPLDPQMSLLKEAAA